MAASGWCDYNLPALERVRQLSANRGREWHPCAASMGTMRNTGRRVATKKGGSMTRRIYGILNPLVPRGNCMPFRVFFAAAIALLFGTASAADLTIALSADITSLDPHYVAAQPNINIGWHVFDALTRVDERARLIPGIAESWRAVKPTTWEFKLHKGVKFHDGSELTTEDVAFSLERPLTITGSPGGFAVYVRPIVAREIVDRYTIRLKTAAPYGALPQDLNSILIVSKKAASNATPADFDSGRAMIGSGPYKFVRFLHGDRVELVRFDGHWEAPAAWDKVTFRVMPTDTARTAALLAGDVDVIEDVPTADLARLRGSPNFRLAQAVSWRTIFSVSY